MKKVLKLLIVSLFVVPLNACSKTPSFEKDFADEPIALEFIQGIIDDVQSHEDVKAFQYVSGDAKDGKAIFTSGKCEITIHVKDDYFLGMDLRDSKESSKNHSDDFEACVTATVPISLGEIEMVELKSLPPDADGKNVIETKFKNNSDHIIERLAFDYMIDDEVFKILSHDRIVPGDTSMNICESEPFLGNFEDAEVIYLDILWEKENGEISQITYNSKTKEYSFS